MELGFVSQGFLFLSDLQEELVEIVYCFCGFTDSWVTSLCLLHFQLRLCQISQLLASDSDSLDW